MLKFAEAVRAAPALGSYVHAVYLRPAYHESPKLGFDPNNVVAIFPAVLQDKLPALKELHNLAMAHGRKARISVVCRDGVLRVMERESTDSFLPEHVLKRFDT